MVLPGIVIPLAGLKPSIHIDQLSLGQELSTDLRQSIPRDAGVVLGPLSAALAAVLVGGDRERRQRPRLPNGWPGCATAYVDLLWTNAAISSTVGS